MKKIYSIIAIITLCLCSCAKEETLKVKDEKPTVGTYHFCVRASVDPKTKSITFNPADPPTHPQPYITSRFESTDKIYVYNETQHALARHYDALEDDYLATAISPTAISGDGKSCTIEGDLTFYKWDDGEDEWVEVTPTAGDKYSLYYQMNDPNYFEGPNFDYTTQKGSALSASNYDFALATNITMILNGSNLSLPDGVSFSSLQSMFCQHLTFTKDALPVNPSSIKLLFIDTENGTLVEYFYPTEEDPDDKNYTFASFIIANPQIANDQDAYFSLAFYYPEDEPESKDDKLIVTAVDNEGNVFKCTKVVPTGGFVKNKFYYGSMEMVWQYQKIKPTVTRTDGGDEDELEPSLLGKYTFSGAENPDQVTISGNSRDYYFYFQNNAIVTLSGNGIATYLSTNETFITSKNGNLTVELGSDYTIDCRSYEYAIYCMRGALKLSTTGSEQKLTIIVNDVFDDYYGLYGFDNDDYFYYGDLTDIAAPGFTVTRSETDNGDGTYTFIYTVTPTP